MEKRVSIATIITCHNRRDKTLLCLEKLFSQNNINDVDISVYLVDDGSTDGTGDAVKKKFAQVQVLLGDGTLYWNGGMRVAFKKALENNHDYYLWLNDDTFIYENTLTALLKTEQKNKEIIVTGSIKDIDSAEINYGGRVRKSKLQPLTFLLLNNKDEIQKCDTFNGNVVLIPHSVAKIIGNISPQYSKQHGGDIDYGLRAKYAGFDTWVVPGVLGECSPNSLDGSIFDKSLSLKVRMKKMRSPQGAPPAKEWMVFAWRHAGWLWPYFWLRTIVRVVFPWTYLLLRKPQK